MIPPYVDRTPPRIVTLEPAARRPVVILAGAFLALLVAAPALGLIQVGRGNDPVRDHNWPAGSLDVANLKTRVAWMEGPPFGGGQHTFLYRGDTAALQAALDLFGKI